MSESAIVALIQFAIKFGIDAAIAIAKGLQAGKFIGGVAKACGGGGGGRPNLAQAGGRDGAALEGALAAALQELKGFLGLSSGP